MKKIKLIVLTVLLITLVSCSTSKSVTPSFVLPKLEAVRPVRPRLLEETDKFAQSINIVNIMGYSKQMEAYAGALEKYIKDIEVIIN